MKIVDCCTGMGSIPHEECSELIYRWRQFAHGYLLALYATATVPMIFVVRWFLSDSSEWEDNFSNFIFSKTALVNQKNVFEKFGPKLPITRKRTDCNHAFMNFQSKRFPHCDTRTENCILYYCKALFFFFFYNVQDEHLLIISARMENVRSPLLFCYLSWLLMGRSEKRKSKQAGSEANTISCPHVLPRAPKMHSNVRVANCSKQFVCA